MVEYEDTNANPRVAEVIEMLARLSLADDPRDVSVAFGPYFWRLRHYDYMITLSKRNLPEGSYRITRRFEANELFAGDYTAKIRSNDPWSVYNTLPTHTGGFLGGLIREPKPTIVRDMSITDDPVLGNEIAQMRSCQAIPHIEGGQAINWNIVFSKDPGRFRVDQLDESLLTANLVGTMVRNLVSMRTIRKLNDQLRAEFENVARVQQALLPAALPNVPGLRVATSYLTSQQAGGDYYDFLSLPDGRTGVLIADVAGHGAAAATVMAMMRAIMHTYPGRDSDPAAVMTYTNQHICRANIEGTFVTAFFGAIDPDKRTLTFTRCGHNVPRRKRGDSITDLEGGAGLPLGVIGEARFESQRVALEPGDELLLYTDGITEALSPDGSMFGVGGLDRAITGNFDDPWRVIDAVHAGLYQHTRSLTRSDDQTIVAIQVDRTESA